MLIMIILKDRNHLYLNRGRDKLIKLLDIIYYEYSITNRYSYYLFLSYFYILCYIFYLEKNI